MAARRRSRPVISTVRDDEHDGVVDDVLDAVRGRARSRRRRRRAATVPATSRTSAAPATRACPSHDQQPRTPPRRAAPRPAGRARSARRRRAAGAERHGNQQQRRLQHTRSSVASGSPQAAGSTPTGFGRAADSGQVLSGAAAGPGDQAEGGDEQRLRADDRRDRSPRAATAAGRPGAAAARRACTAPGAEAPVDEPDRPGGAGRSSARRPRPREPRRAPIPTNSRATASSSQPSGQPRAGGGDQHAGDDPARSGQQQRLPRRPRPRPRRGLRATPVPRRRATGRPGDQGGGSDAPGPAHALSMGVGGPAHGARRHPAPRPDPEPDQPDHQQQVRLERPDGGSRKSHTRKATTSGTGDRGRTPDASTRCSAAAGRGTSPIRCGSSAVDHHPGVADRPSLSATASYAELAGRDRAGDVPHGQHVVEPPHAPQQQRHDQRQPGARQRVTWARPSRPSGRNSVLTRSATARPLREPVARHPTRSGRRSRGRRTAGRRRTAAAVEQAGEHQAGAGRDPDGAGVRRRVPVARAGAVGGWSVVMARTIRPRRGAAHGADDPIANRGPAAQRGGRQSRGTRSANGAAFSGTTSRYSPGLDQLELADRQPSRHVRIMSDPRVGEASDRAARRLRAWPPGPARRLLAQRDRPRAAAELLVHPDLVTGRQLVDLRDRPPVEHEHRGLALGPHRLDQRLHDPGPLVALVSRGRRARSTRTTPIPPAPTRGLTTACRTAHAVGDLGRVGQRARSGRPARHPAGEVGLVARSRRTRSPVEETRRSTARGPGEELRRTRRRSPTSSGPRPGPRRTSRRSGRPSTPSGPRCRAPRGRGRPAPPALRPGVAVGGEEDASTPG